MTGPGRSPSSPWGAQGSQGYSHDTMTASSFHPMLSPSHPSFPATASLSERTSPNYFGLAVDSSSNPPTSNSGPHVQKNWSSLNCNQSSLPSPKLHLYSQESVSEGLVNLLRSESDIDKGRRESVLQRRPSNGIPSNSNVNPSFSIVNSPETTYRAQQRTGSVSQGKKFSTIAVLYPANCLLQPPPQNSPHLAGSQLSAARKSFNLIRKSFFC